ncbi:endoglin isoform X2 [Myiozetetes cayanensis]|uniref:endoglin isoform X2 n=1 Tax=Myiozetetes cayanensis TaxID=478635 RepID=UPI00215E241E|nr:endoglin isoform X2 [Myiozetetes cayanensis]
MAPRTAPLLPLLLALLGRPDPGRAEGCDLQPVTGESPIALSYTTSTVPRGCVSSGSLGTDHEVHVLSVKWSKTPAVLLTVSITPGADACSRSPVLILFCARCSANITSQCPHLLIHTDAHLFSGSTAEPLMASSEEELLNWAQSTYRGITSYSELRDPRWVQLRLGEDASSPPNCIPQNHFNAMLHLETEVFFHGVKSCSRGDTQSTRAAHIIHLQPEPSSLITEVNLSLSCPENHVSNQILILQSRANLTWSLSFKKCNIQVMTSGNYKIMTIFPTLLPGELLPDTEQGLIAKAFEKNYSIIASYSAIPATTSISMEIQENKTAKKVTEMITPMSRLTPAPELQPHQLLLLLKPWTCTDETMEITIIKSHLKVIKDLDIKDITLRDISCQAEKNATHFMLKSPLSHCGTLLGGRGYANNELLIKLSKGTELQDIRVAFQCEIPRELFLRLFPTAAFKVPQTELEVNKEAFLQASMLWDDHPADLQLKDCWLVAPGQEPVLLVQGGEARGAGVAVLEGPPSSHGRKIWRFRFTYAVPEGGRTPFSATLKCKAGLQNNTNFEKVLKVTVKDTWQPPNSRGLGLAAVLGITFGAFLIGALLTAGLWCIYSRTRPISKLQPVSSTAPASESSSTNHSIGSTQSTPCSTSSMA